MTDRMPRAGKPLTSHMMYLANNSTVATAFSGLSASSASSSYTNIGLSVTFEKVYDETDLIVEIHADCTVNATVQTLGMFGVHINSINHDVVPVIHDVASGNVHTHGSESVHNLPAGSYVGLVRLKRTGGSGTLTLGSNSYASIKVRESL